MTARATRVSAAVLVLLVGGFLRWSMAPRRVRIVALGDSITAGVRDGVKAGDTFCSVLQAELAAQGFGVEMVNVGLGGERADQALRRLESAVISRQPDAVLVMYGTNDSFVYPGKTGPDLPLDRYRDSLVSIVTKLRERGIQPVLMTSPRWGAGAQVNGIGEPHNKGLEIYVQICRQVAQQLNVPIVDHFAHWTAYSKDGLDSGAWTTDQCHPNPKGHREIAALAMPTLKALVADLANHDGFAWLRTRAANAGR